MSILKEQDKLILKFIWENKCARLPRKTLDKKSSGGGGELALTDIEACCKACVIKTV